MKTQNKNKHKTKIISDLLRVGALMSNVCFNMAQPGWIITDHDRINMNKLRVEWDKLYSEYRKM